MAIGLRQRHPDTGAELINISTRLPRIIGRVTISPGVSGSVVVPASGNNPLFYYFAVDGAMSDYNASPVLSDDGANTITWTMSSRFAIGGVLTYGRY